MRTRITKEQALTYLMHKSRRASTFSPETIVVPLHKIKAAFNQLQRRTDGTKED